MRTNIEEEVFGKLSKFAGRLGWSEREALGLLGLFWHDSQIEGMVVCNKEELFDFCRLYNEEEELKEKILSALIRTGFIEQVGEDQFSIKGNQKQVEVLSAFKEKTKKATAARIGRIRGNDNVNVTSTITSDDRDDNVNVTSTSQSDNVNETMDVTQCNAIQSNAIQSNAIQSNAIQSSSKQSNPKQSNATQNKTSVEEFDFSKFWEKYPNDGRLNKQAAIKRFNEQIKTIEQYDDLLKSVDNYVLHLTKTKKACKHATSFLGTTGPKSQGIPWIDFIDDPHLPEINTKQTSFAEQRSADRWAMVEELERKQQEQFEREVVDANG